MYQIRYGFVVISITRTGADRFCGDRDAAMEVQTNFVPSQNSTIQQNHTKFGTHNYMLLLLLLIEDNVKGTRSLDSLACEIPSPLLIFPLHHVVKL